MYRAIAVTLLMLAAGTAIAAGVAMGSKSAGQKPQPHGNFTLAQAQDFKEFALYSGGNSVEGQPLVAIKRIDSPKLPDETIRNDAVTFLYGLCEIPSGEHACASPLQVQLWPACQRYQALYAFAPDESLSVRGVPAAFYEDGARLELYTGKVTVVIFGQEKSQLLRVAQALRGVNNARSVNDKLPPTAVGAREGRVSC